MKVNLRWVYSGDVTNENAASLLGGVDGILVAPGFGERGTEGQDCRYALCPRERHSFLGNMLGMQMAVVEFARDVLGLKQAHSSEIDPTTPIR